MTGKKQNILIENVIYTDTRTGIEKTSDRQFTVWTDAGLKENIKSVDGVVAVYVGQPYETQYHVFVDPRYDLEFVKREVEAVITCELE